MIDHVMKALWCLGHGAAFALWDDGAMGVEFPELRKTIEVTAVQLDELTRRGWVEFVDGADGHATRVELTESGRYHLAKWERRNHVMMRTRTEVT